MSVVKPRVIGPNDPDFLAYRKRVKDRQHLSAVHGIRHYEAEVDELLDTTPSQRGERLPWPKTHDNIRLRDSELSLWAGKNSHGKSSLLAQILTWRAGFGDSIMIASFEMPVKLTIEKMLKQATGLGSPTKQVRQEFFRRMEGKVYFYDYQGTVSPDLVMDLCEFSADILGCQHIQIDSLTKVKGMVSDDNGLQADFVNNLHASAKHFGTHIHLVAHERKGSEEGERKVGSRYSVKGSGAIADQVDNVFIVWMDKDKKQKGELTEEEEQKPDILVRCDKQRHGTWEGYFGLYFSRNESFQFVQNMDGRPMKCPGMF